MSQREDAMTVARRVLTCTAAIAALAATALIALEARAGDILADWNTAKIPPPPEAKPVTLEGRTTALLLLDYMKDGCNRRERCRAIMPGMKALHDAARGAGAMLFYTLVGGDNPKPTDVVEGVQPKDGEWVFQRGPDKFLGSPLEQRLKDPGIRTL